MLQKEPSDRPSAHQLRLSDWLRSGIEPCSGSAESSGGIAARGTGEAVNVTNEQDAEDVTEAEAVEVYSGEGAPVSDDSQGSTGITKQMLVSAAALDPAQPEPAEPAVRLSMYDRLMQSQSNPNL